MSIDKAKSALEYASSYPVRDAKDMALLAIANALVAIAEGRGEIVRCRNCVSWFRGECRKHVYTITVDGTEYNEGSFPMDASDFCSLGTRREES